MAKRAKTSTLPPRKHPVWSGPYDDGTQSCGITQSLLGRLFVCPERFRLLTVLGLRETAQFDHKIEYGQMWHVCEEAYSAKTDWKVPLRQYAISLRSRWSNHHADIDKWYEICKRQFPLYVAEYKKDDAKRKPFMQEHVFRESYKLPSGRTILLRGKFDAVIEEGKKHLRLQENKVKGDLNEDRVVNEIGSNLQTMLYLAALRSWLDRNKHKDYQVDGVLYNMIRRPLGDWRGTFNISQRKGRKTKKGIVGAETLEEYYDRLALLIKANASHFFFRIRVEIHKHDMTKFFNECFIPRMEWLCDWWEWIKEDPQNPWRKGNHVHWRAPFGVYDPLLEGRQGDYYNYINTGSLAGLERIDSLFGELK